MPELNYSVLFEGNFSQDQVFIEEIPSSRLIDNQLEDKCKEEWERKLREAKATGKQVWDSTVYRFELATIDNGTLNLTLSTIPFSVRIAMNSFTNEVTQLGFDYAARGMYTSYFVITNDGKYVFIEDGGKYLDRRKYMFIGGTLSKTEQELKTGGDLFNETKKECIEEAGCLPTDIDKISLRAGYITSSYSICLIFNVTLNLSFAQLIERFQAGNDGEAKNLIGIPLEKISNFALELHEKEHPKFIIMGLMKG